MLIRVVGVTVRYDSVEALRDVTFEVREGELVGVIGPNGAGKTTLLRCLYRALEPRRGAIFIDGRNLASIPRRELAKIMAVVPQEDATAPLTVLETILMGRYPHTGSLFRILDGAVREIEEIVSDLGLEGILTRRLTEISGGERRRVHIARALAQTPKVLLLDEPTAHLDLNFQLQVMDLILRYTKARRVATIATFHDLSLAARYCDRVLLLSRGKIHAAGRPEEVITPENIEKVYGVRVRIVREKGRILAVVPIEPVR